MIDISKYDHYLRNMDLECIHTWTWNAQNINFSLFTTDQVHNSDESHDNKGISAETTCAHASD